MPSFSEFFANGLGSSAATSNPTKLPATEQPPPPGYNPVTVVEQPIKLTRNLTFTVLGISVAVSVVIDGLIHLVLG